MNTRIKLSVFLLILGTLLAFIPQRQKPSFKIKRKEMIRWATREDNSFTPDQVAKMINQEDSAILLIDVRNQEEYNICRLPGAINIPLANITDKKYETWLNEQRTRKIFYSNGDETSAIAMTLSRGMGYQNLFQLTGGLNSWYSIIMNSTFSGDQISAQENALFENRYAARRLFTEYNSLPDSLKDKLFAAKQTARAKLDGGCE